VKIIKVLAKKGKKKGGKKKEMGDELPLLMIAWIVTSVDLSSPGCL
jgi:hypothetical protein